MKRVLCDHNVPARLARHLDVVDAKLARSLGWAELRNGELLLAAEHTGFHVLLTCDQNMAYEQNMAGRKIGVVSLSDNHWKIVRNYVPAILEAIHNVQPGEVLPVFCGVFVPRRLRKAD
ncbi:MAG: hypothetical protein JO091_07565 [Acidobacteriaceae bacterium]|nr:hypothetical protein [Acidobacteriaceae bacterium]